MIVSINGEAEAELADAAHRGMEQGGEALAEAVIDEFERTIALLMEHPHIGVRFRKYRRFSLRRFPFSVIYYMAGPEELRVVAFAHHRQKPGYWARRS